MFDVHSHILPAIDDGAKDWEMSLTMLEIARDHGTTDIFATPHVIEGSWLPAWEEIVSLCQKLQSAAADAGISINIFPGAEVAIHMDILEKIAGPGPYCLNGGRYTLVELPAAEIPRFTEDFFFTLQARGVTPVLAHPERHPVIMRNPELLLEWIHRGILLQVNAPSLTGRFGEKVMATAELLLNSKMAHLIGSDAHSARTRNPDMSHAARKITAMLGPEAAKRLLVINPASIANGEDIDAPMVTGLTRPSKPGRIQQWLAMLCR